MIENTALKQQQQEIAELVSTAIVLSSEDRAVLLCSANALKTRKEIEEARKTEKPA